MKKNILPLLLIAGAGIGFYFYNKNKGAKQLETDKEAEQSQETAKEGEQLPSSTEVDAVIDTKQQNLSVSEAIAKGKELATGLQNANIVIKTPAGMPNINITKGAKFFKGSKKRKIKKTMAKNCAKIKNAKRRKACIKAKAGLGLKYLAPRFI